MKKIVLIIISVCISHITFAQFQVEFSYGFGTYSMGDLKEINKDILEALPVQGQITDNFPGQPYFDAGVYYQMSDVITFGINCNYHSTGSRISYKDYSGDLKIDNVLSAFAPGIVFGFKLIDKRIIIEEENNFSLAFSKLKMEESILEQKNEYNFTSHNPQFEPRLKMSTNISAFKIGLRTGYLIDFGGKNKLEGDNDNILQNRDNEVTKTNWSGVRIAATIAYVLK